MRVPILGGGGTNVDYIPPDDATSYGQLHGNHTWHAAAAGWYQVVPCAGKFSDLLVATRTSPGAGKSFTLALYKSTGVTLLSVTISEETNRGEDTTNEVTVADGDLVSMQHVPAGSPSLTPPKYTVLFTPDDATKGIFLGNTEGAATGELNDGTTEYASIASGGIRLNNTESIWPQPMPTSGKFTSARVTLDAAPDPGAADGYRFTLRKDGADTGIVITITGDDTTGTATADVTFAADEAFNWKIEPVGTPAATPHAGWGLVYEPDIVGEAIVLGQTYSQPHQTNTNMNTMTHWAITPWVTFSDPSHDTENSLWEMTVKKLHVRLEDDPLIHNSYTFTVYRRAWGLLPGADTLLTVTIANSDTEGGDDVNEVSAADYDQVRMKCVPNGVPELTRASWGLVMELPSLAAGFGGTRADVLVKNALI